MHTRTSPPPRRGSVYLPVLIASMVAATLALGGILAARSVGRSASLRSDTSAARQLALSAIEIGRARIATDPDWRSNLSTGAWVSSMTLGPGKVSLDAASPFGSLDRDPDPPLVLTGTGTVGRAVQRITVTLTPNNTTALSSLSAAMASASNMALNTASVGPAAMLIASNANITSNSSGTTVSASARARSLITGTQFNGTTSPGSPLLEFPDPAVISTYAALATPISYTALPLVSGTRAVSEVLLSPDNNPFGSRNASGFYTINCAGGPLLIEDSRIVGTLIITNASTVTVAGFVNWSPATANLPALLIAGNLSLQLDSTRVLDEDRIGPFVSSGGTGEINLRKGNPPGQSPQGVNLNSPGTPYPYPSGSSDNKLKDQYPTVIDGLIYATGSATLTNANRFHTLLCGGTLTVSGAVTLTRDNRYRNAPPEGFTPANAAPFRLEYR